MPDPEYEEVLRSIRDTRLAILCWKEVNTSGPKRINSAEKLSVPGMKASFHLCLKYLLDLGKNMNNTLDLNVEGAFTLIEAGVIFFDFY